MNRNLLGALVGLGMTGFFVLEFLQRLNALNTGKIISLGVRGRTGIPNQFEVLTSAALAVVCFGVVIYSIYLWQKGKS
jgi:hypothetical protein